MRRECLRVQKQTVRSPKKETDSKPGERTRPPAIQVHTHKEIVLNSESGGRLQTRKLVHSQEVPVSGSPEQTEDLVHDQ